VKAGRYVQLLVSDTGAGIPPEVVVRIFEPFYTTKPKGHGTGLGLATVHGIVTAAGGSINVCSKPGIGTTFRVYFPAADPPPDSAHVRPAAAAAPRGHGQRVLIVEDEPVLGASIARILATGGYHVRAAAGGPEAITLHARDGCDLLLADVVMPEMSGPRLAEILHRTQPRLPVLYVSGYTGGTSGPASLLEPGTDLIEKPFSVNQLLTAVGNALAGGTGQDGVAAAHATAAKD
jgi:two-component system cell cycle sensor histidine kinase/response regulator CckA